MTLEEAIKAVEDSISELKQFLISEELLVQNPDEEGELVTNQSPQAREEYLARKFLDVRF